MTHGASRGHFGVPTPWRFDLWVQRWRTTQAHGDVVIVRFADDFVVGFQHGVEAERFLADLRERFARFGLALHADKAQRRRPCMRRCQTSLESSSPALHRC
jgi:hypothetical protein